MDKIPPHKGKSIESQIKRDIERVASRGYSTFILM